MKVTGWRLTTLRDLESEPEVKRNKCERGYTKVGEGTEIYGRNTPTKDLDIGVGSE